MNQSLRIDKGTETGDVLVLRVGGRLDSRGAIVLREYCAPHLITRKCIVLNVQYVNFLSSSGVGALLALTEAAKEAGGRLHIAGAAGSVLSTLELLNLDKYLSLHPSEEEAVLAAR